MTGSNSSTGTGTGTVPTEVLEDYRQSFEFCRVEASHCRLLSVVMVDGFQVVDGEVYHPGSEYTVSDNYYQVRYGACNDSFTIALSSQKKLTTNPPFPLEEPYYRCRETKAAALITAWGVSSGNMSTIVPVLVLLILTLFITFSKMRFRPIPETYSSDEREAVLDYLAFNLLLIRDKRYTPAGGAAGSAHQQQRDASPLTELYQELGRHEKIPKFFYERGPGEGGAVGGGGDDVVLETTRGVMMTTQRPQSSKDEMSPSRGLTRTSSIRAQARVVTVSSEGAIITQSQYDQLMNPLYVPPPSSVPSTLSP
jgi:hypothetical protein